MDEERNNLVAGQTKCMKNVVKNVVSLVSSFEDNPVYILIMIFCYFCKSTSFSINQIISWETHYFYVLTAGHAQTLHQCFNQGFTNKNDMIKKNNFVYLYQYIEDDFLFIMLWSPNKHFLNCKFTSNEKLFIENLCMLFCCLKKVEIISKINSRLHCIETGDCFYREE